MKNGRFIISYVLLFVLLIVLLAVNVCIGSVNVPLGDLLGASGQEKMATAYDIVMRLRLPRAIAAILLGGGLALSGYLLQTFFHNPIAGPFILGISSGAKLVVALVMVFALESAFTLSSSMMVIAAFIGAMVSMGFVLLMSKLVNKMSILIISGVMIGYICSAITDLVVTFADDSDIVNLHNWSRGSFSGISWANVRVMCVVIIICLICSFFLSKPMSAFQMGETYAKSVGVNLPLFRALLVILSSLLSATVTAFAGPVSFVGIAVPHLVKNLLKTTRPILMIPAVFLGGGAFCLFCDFLSRIMFSPTELSISTVTAIFGAPVVIVILVKRKGGR